MISLGLRLVVNGGREAVTRLVILTVAVGLGVGLLLTAVAATNAAVTWNNRHARFWTGTTSGVPRTAAPAFYLGKKLGLRNGKDKERDLLEIDTPSPPGAQKSV